LLQNFKVVTERKLLIHQLPAYQLAYMFETQNVRLGGMVTFINSGVEVYLVIASASNQQPGDFLRYKGLFEEITNSFSIQQ
jgi:hypothetical protein